jgi:hypothetical protein
VSPFERHRIGGHLACLELLRDVLQLEARRFQPGGQRPQLRVGAGQGKERAFRVGDQLRGPLFRAQVPVGLSQALGNGLGLLQSHGLLHQTVVLAGHDPRLLDLVDLPPQGVELPVPVAFGRGQSAKVALCRAPSAHGGRDLLRARYRLRSRDAIQRRPLPSRSPDSLVLVLARDLDHRRRDLRHQSPGDEPAVDARPAPASVGRYRPGHDQFDRAVVDALDHPLGHQPPDRGVLGGEEEASLDARLLGPRSDQATIGPAPQEQSQRRDHQRLSRPGLTGQSARPTLEAQLGALDDAHALDYKLGQHPRESYWWPGGTRGS